MKWIFALAMCTACLSNAAFASDSREVLSIKNVKEGDIVVAVPTTKDADGTICTGFVSRASRDGAGKLDVEVSKVCGPTASATASDEGHPAEFPANLLAMRLHQTGDLTVQVPDIAVGRKDLAVQ